MNYYVRDVEAAVRFYVEWFGFEEMFRTPAVGTPEHVEVRLGRLLLGRASTEAPPRSHGLTTGGGNPRAEVCLWTNDVDRADAEMVANGAPSLSPPHDFLDDRRRAARLADLGGNPAEIVTRREAGGAKLGGRGHAHHWRVAPRRTSLFPAGYALIGADTLVVGTGGRGRRRGSVLMDRVA